MHGTDSGKGFSMRIERLDHWKHELPLSKVDSVPVKHRRACCALLLLFTLACLDQQSGGVGGTVAAGRLSDDPWLTDPAWYDGRAERCVYEATRSIYGLPRPYRATAYTNKQLMDPRTTTKSADGRGLEVFKHHWSERVPTERYDYDFSTAVFTHTADLTPFKLTVGTQEDCGASFKQIWLQDGRLHWAESVYFPGAGLREGRLPERRALHFADELPLVLRDYPFARPLELRLWIVPSQKDTRRVPFEPVERRVVYVGVEDLDLPIGSVRAYRLDLRALAEHSAAAGMPDASYWVASDGASPWLHVLVQYEGADGTSYHLASHDRTAYWER